MFQHIRRDAKIQIIFGGRTLARRYFQILGKIEYSLTNIRFNHDFSSYFFARSNFLPKYDNMAKSLDWQCVRIMNQNTTFFEPRRVLTRAKDLKPNENESSKCACVRIQVNERIQVNNIVSLLI